MTGKASLRGLRVGGRCHTIVQSLAHGGRLRASVCVSSVASRSGHGYRARVRPSPRRHGLVFVFLSRFLFWQRADHVPAAAQGTETTPLISVNILLHSWRACSCASCHSDIVASRASFLIICAPQAQPYNGICDAGPNWDNISFNPRQGDMDCKLDPDFHFLDNVDKQVRS